MSISIATNYYNYHFLFDTSVIDIMGSCVSTKNRSKTSRPSKYGLLASKRSKFTNQKNKKKSCKRLAKSNAPSFIYIPDSATGTPEIMSPSNYLQTWSNILKKKRQVSGSTETNFAQIYRKSGVVDKKLFLSTGFIADEIYSPTSPSLLTPITPAIPTTVIDSTFPRSAFLSPTRLESESQLLPTPGFTTALYAARYNSLQSRAKSGVRHPRITTQESGVTTYISQDRELWEPEDQEDPIYFNFDEDTVKSVHRFYASSLKTEVIGLF